MSNGKYASVEDLKAKWGEVVIDRLAPKVQGNTLDTGRLALMWEEVERKFTGNLGSVHKTLANKRVKVNFSVELSGTGTAGGVPKWGDAIQSCGMREVVDTTNKQVFYKPAGTNYKSATLVFNVDGMQHVLSGARGTFSIDFNAAEFPKINFEFIGLYNVATKQTPLTSTYTGWHNALVVGKANTPVAKLDNTDIAIATLNIDVANELQYVDRTNQEEVQLRNRNASGSINMTAIDLSDKNFFTRVESEGLVPLNIEHGTVAGNIVGIKAPKVQLTSPAYADNGGELMQTFALSLVPYAGNDEFEIIVK